VTKPTCHACGRSAPPASESNPTGTKLCSTCGKTYCAVGCFAAQHGPAPVLSRRWTIASALRRLHGRVA